MNQPLTREDVIHVLRNRSLYESEHLPVLKAKFLDKAAKLNNVETTFYQDVESYDLTAIEKSVAFFRPILVAAEAKFHIIYVSDKYDNFITII